jgi:hypothetical protein
MKVTTLSGRLNMRKLAAAVHETILDVMPLIALGIVLSSADAWAQAGLSGIATKINSFNTEIILIGGALAVTGFLRAALAILMGLGSAASAVVMLAVGMAIAAAPQIVGFFVTGVGA